MKRAATLLAALTIALGAIAAVPSAAGAQTDGQPANQARRGPNLTLVVADCSRHADMAVARSLAQHARHAAPACLGEDGVGAELAVLIAEFRPDRVVAVGGADAVTPAVMDELRSEVRAAYRWAIVQRLDGATRVETAAAAARVALEAPSVVGADTVTLVVADGWDDAGIDIAREFAATFDKAALAYYSPATVSDGLPEATASLIADYRPARVVFAGYADEAGRAAEAAAAAVLRDIGSAVAVERVAPAAALPDAHADAASLMRDAHALFTAISNGERVQRGTGEGDPLPFVALTRAATGPDGARSLWTLRADGSDRILRTDRRAGWGWHPTGGRLIWADADARVMAADPGSEGHLLDAEGIWPWSSPDGTHLIAWNVADTDGDDRSDSFEAVLHDADGERLRSLGQMDVRTWYYAEVTDALWSPDGTRLAYVTAHADPETGETVNQARIGLADDSAPAVALADDAIVIRWAPDGRHLLYATAHDCDADEDDDSWELFVTDADGSEARRVGIIDFDAFDVLIVNPWSPDGTHFAYRALDPQDCSPEVRVSSVEPDAEPLTVAADANFLGWSPDSVYLEYGVETDRPVTDYLLPEHSWIVRRDGLGKRYIGEVSPSAYGWVFWSPDGSRISYSEILRDGDGNEVTLAARTELVDGSDGTTTLAELGNSLSWSPDGRVAYVAYHDDDGDGVPDREALYVHTPRDDADDVELVHTLPAATRVVIWSPDSSYLIYASGSIESLVGWFRDRGRGVEAWSVAADGSQWTHRLTADVTWGEWQPLPAAG